ncbi:MAG: IS66 family transposase zinc-finger binding domain-containing protein [Thermoplasmatota archaeon]|jgi:ribosomal protein L37AE/L43A
MYNWPIEAVQYIQKLEQRIQELERELQKIKTDFEEYKKKHPPNVGVKDGKPYAFKSVNQSSTPKKPGAKPGHKPYFRSMPDHIDFVRRIPVLVCPECGRTQLSKKAQQIRTRTYEDIPVYTPIVVRLEIERWYCRTCKKLVETPVTGVLPKARFSLPIMLIVTWLKVHLRMTEEAISVMFKRLFGLKLSEGEVIHILVQVAQAFGPYYQQLIEGIRDAPARNIDETI